MKKIVKRPDGTEEVLEGTAEEIAEFERRLRETVREAPREPQTGRRVLTDELRRLMDQSDLPDLIRDAVERMREQGGLWPKTERSTCPGCGRWSRPAPLFPGISGPPWGGCGSPGCSPVLVG